MNDTNVITNFKNFFKNNTSSFIATIFIIMAMLLIYFVIKIILNHYKNTHKESKNAILLANTILKSLFYFLIVITIIIILYAFGVNVGSILIGIAIILVCFLFSAHKLIYDIINGLCIILGNYYEVDDIIKIDEFKGKVVEISLRVTKVLSWQNEVKIIRNGEIKNIINYSHLPHVSLIAIEFDKSLDLNKIESLLDGSLEKLKDSFKQIVEGPYVSGIISLTDKTYTLGVTVKTDPEKNIEVEKGIMIFINNLFINENINSTFSVKVINNDN